MRSSHSQETSRWKEIVARIVCVGVISVTLTQWAQGQSSAFAVLSSSDVTMKNRVSINRGNVGGTTILMGRGNAAAPDLISGDVIASANASQGLNCSNNPPGTTAICLGNDSEIAGACVTGGGAVSLPSECAKGTDTSAGVTMLSPAIGDMATLSANLAALQTTETLPAIVLGTRGTATISTSGGGCLGGGCLYVVSVASITTGTNSTLTLSGASTDTLVINIGIIDPGSLQLGNGASVVLADGITPDRVIFNLIGSGTTAQLGNHTVFNGSLLAPQGQFTSGDGDTPNPVLINGALLFGGSIAIGNNTNLAFYPFVGAGGGGVE